MSLEYFFSTFSSFFYFLVVLGLAVIFHEWGHFIVAKLTGAKVDEFAVGFGKKLFKFFWRETEYTVRALPLGGFVKIRGMDPDEELTGAEWEFLQLAPWRRILIVVAGPFMNFVLAYLLYAVVLFSFGEAYTATTTIGQAPVGSLGWQMGLREDDRIVAVNDQPVDSWDKITLYQSSIQSATIALTIERGGETLHKVGTIPSSYFDEDEGVEVPDQYNGVFVTKVIPDSPADQAGLTAGVSIVQVDGKKIDTRGQFADYVSERFEKKEDGTYRPLPVSIVCQTPDGATQTLALTPELIPPADDAIPYQPKAQLGTVFVGEISIQEYLTPTMPPLGIAPKIDPVIGVIKGDSPAAKAGVTKDSRIVEINGRPIEDWLDVLQAIHGVEITKQKETYTASPLEITWLSPDNQMHTASITPDVTLQNILTPTSIKTGKRYPMPTIGVDVKSDRIQVGVLGAITGGWEKIEYICGFMFQFLGQLFTGNVSPTVLGGPIAIFQFSGETGRWGMERFLEFIALLSVNLAILNLFPFPPFDGGHAVVYTVEMIRMKPITMKQMETFGKVGFALVIPLFIFLIYNDLARTNLFAWVKGLFF
ncbi:MAG: RIP metalloprotease RseP [Candidatus Omnitrophica bacterium]|nr:RIP metalloprotease RseP [Candidatus Omnitrophota bacterium]